MSTKLHQCRNMRYWLRDGFTGVYASFFVTAFWGWMRKSDAKRSKQHRLRMNVQIQVAEPKVCLIYGGYLSPHLRGKSRLRTRGIEVSIINSSVIAKSEEY
jgi:hypothetical protein